ncbi:MAG: DUF1587 domain-containing protein, partial [Planctomycetota bacterium]
MLTNSLFGIILFGPWQTSPSQVQADESEQLRQVQREYLDRILPVFQNECFDCHSGEEPDAGFRMDQYRTIDQILKARKKWKKVFARVAAHEMPPADVSRLNDQDHKLVLAWIEKMLDSVDCTQINPGQVTVRRLNRIEYRNTIRDLTGVDFAPAESFPGDDVGYGFDNIAEVLSLPPLLMEKYLDAAETITDRAIVDPAEPMWTTSFTGSDIKKFPGSGLDGLTHVLSSNGTITKQVRVPEKGQYVVKILAHGTPVDDQWPIMEVSLDGKKIGGARVRSPRGEAEHYQFKARFRKPDGKLGISFTNDAYKPKVADRNLYIEQVSVSATARKLPASHTLLIGSSPVGLPNQIQAARSAINRFASKAYRRRVYSDELTRLTRLYQNFRESGESHEIALKHCFQAVLVSPFFLYKVEIPTSAGQVRNLTDFELATSLSYFLWSTMPDAELFRSAATMSLKKPEVYQQQLTRMLADPKSAALVDNFVAQWLQLGHLQHVKPDP